MRLIFSALIFIAMLEALLFPRTARAQDKAPVQAPAAVTPAQTETPAPAPVPAPAPPQAETKPSVPAPAAPPEPAETVARKYVELWNTGNLDLLRSLVPFFMTSHGHRVPVDEGMMRRVIDTWRRSMPDLNFKIGDTIIQGDKVAMRLTFTGTYKALLFPFTVPPAKSGPPRVVRGTEMLFFTIKDGRIVDIWEEYDELVMRAQMGGTWNVPPPEPQPASPPATETAPPAPETTPPAPKP